MDSKVNVLVKTNLLCSITTIETIKGDCNDYLGIKFVTRHL